MSVAQEVGEQLARDVLRQMDESGDELLARDVAKVLEASSVPTLEHFNAAMRAFGADQRARAVMANRAKPAP